MIIDTQMPNLTYKVLVQFLKMCSIYGAYSVEYTLEIQSRIFYLPSSNLPNLKILLNINNPPLKPIFSVIHDL